jgi:uncharacterized membrane protein
MTWAAQAVLVMTVAIVALCVHLVATPERGLGLSGGGDGGDDGRRRARRVRYVNAITTLAALVVALVAGSDPARVLAVMVLPLVPVAWLMVEAARVRPNDTVPARYAVPLTAPPPGRRYVSSALQLANAALVALACAAFALVASRLPERIPVHWDRYGRVNRWGRPGELWLFAMIMALFVVLPWFVAFGVARERWALPPDAANEAAPLQLRRRTLIVRLVESISVGVNASLAVGWLAAAIGALPGRANVVGVGVLASVAIAGVSVVGSIAVLSRPLTRVHEALRVLGGSPALGTRSDGWKWNGLVYYSPDDPAVFVPKRRGVGQSLNFARPSAWLFVAAVLVLPLVILATAMWLTRK